MFASLFLQSIILRIKDHVTIKRTRATLMKPTRGAKASEGLAEKEKPIWDFY